MTKYSRMMVKAHKIFKLTELCRFQIIFNNYNMFYFIPLAIYIVYILFFLSLLILILILKYRYIYFF
jgi:hypothetical protein